ncbi:MAG: ribonuclease J [Alphaproteobacteria bacterium]|nr:ribonuclease J [Alphaproteobacteria bacterium]
MRLPSPAGDEILFVSLGGVGNIGMNCALYGHAGRWILVDLGIMFGDETTPGIEVIVPDTSVAEAVRDQLDAIVITHAHEDHIGAVPYLWPELGVPIHVTPFSAAFLRRKLQDEGTEDEAPIVEHKPGERFAVGPFELEYLPLAHSIPEPNALVLRTAAGTVFHTGDWKLDSGPVVGEPVDERIFRRLGDEGVAAMVCDSTNATIDGASGSEADLLESLTDLIASRSSRVAFACFASNVARLDTVARAAETNGRSVSLVGRSLKRMNDIARQCGYLADIPSFVSEQHSGYLPPSSLVLICTGSQGEPRAALARIASGFHPHVSLEGGDTLVFSSRTIPGNERAVAKLQNQFLRMGVQIVTSRDAFVHVSGHPGRDELRRMYGWIRPKAAIPVHGEFHHLRAHAELARGCGVDTVAEIEDGILLRIAQGGVEQLGDIRVGRLGLDGGRLVRLDSEHVQARRRLSKQGLVAASVLLNGRGSALAEPRVSSQGIVAEDEVAGLASELAARSSYALERLPPLQRRDDNMVEKAIRTAIRRHVREHYGRRPLVEVHVMRLDEG